MLIAILVFLIFFVSPITRLFCRIGSWVIMIGLVVGIGISSQCTSMRHRAVDSVLGVVGTADASPPPTQAHAHTRRR